MFIFPSSVQIWSDNFVNKYLSEILNNKYLSEILNLQGLWINTKIKKSAEEKGFLQHVEMAANSQMALLWKKQQLFFKNGKIMMQGCPHMSRTVDSKL